MTKQSRLISEKQLQILGWFTAGVLVFAFLFLRHYFGLAVLAAIFAYLLHPIHKRLTKHLKPGAAAMLTMLISFILFVIPVGLIIFLSVNQVKELLSQVNNHVVKVDPGQIGNNIVVLVNNFLSKFSFISFRLTTDSLNGHLLKLLEAAGTWLLNSLTSSVSSIFSIIANIITFIFIFLSFILKHDKIIEYLRVLNPLGEKTSDLFLEKTGAMVKGTVKGQFVIALIQGFIGAAVITLTGLHGYFFLFFIVLTALSVIPLGGGVLVIPIGILMIIFGNPIGGIIVIATHLLITTNVDNILRPWLVPKSARLDPALMLVSVFSGIAFFGFLGIVLGPVLMILVVTTVDLYVEQKMLRAEEKTA